ncbi:MAG: helix-turn-helix domain-containing protein [Micrococcales bacterium]|nr:helix-turn-helix domain-containing protein [Micrococcales bacterium]
MAVSHGAISATSVSRLRSRADRLVGLVLRRVSASSQWYRDLSPQHQSSVGLVVRASISAFISWCERPDSSPPTAMEIFAAAPAELTQSVSLQHTLQLFKMGMEVIEEDAEGLAASGQGGELRSALLTYSRDFAFAAALVYARAAESRGQWDARLEALLVDGLLRAEESRSLTSRAAALGWTGEGSVLGVAASVGGPVGAADVVELRRAVRRAASMTLLGIQSDRVVIVLGGLGDLKSAVLGLCSRLGERVVIGPTVGDIASASSSVQAASAGLDAARGWPGVPRPVLADDLLPERLLLGDAAARTTLLETIYNPLASASPELLPTLWAYLSTGGSVGETARTLGVHPNTVRNRLSRTREVCAHDPTTPRQAHVLRTALTVGRLSLLA